MKCIRKLLAILKKQDRFTTRFKTCGTGSLFRGWSRGSKSIWCHSCADSLWRRKKRGFLNRSNLTWFLCCLDYFPRFLGSKKQIYKFERFKKKMCVMWLIFYSILLNSPCEMSLFTKREHSLIFSGLKKSSFLKSMLLLNFPIRSSSNILNKNNILMMLNKCLIQWFWVDVTI